MESRKRLRLAVSGDELAVAAVHVRGWQVAYQGLIPERYLADMRPEDLASRYTFESAPGHPVTVLAVQAGEIVGFVTLGAARDEDSAGLGQVYALYGHPDHWGRGIGRALMMDARQRLARQGWPAALLWVLRGNRRAARFYARDGWQPDGAERQEEVHGVPLDELRYRRSLP